jgi:hypothetical protein
MYDNEISERAWWDREIFKWGDHPEQVCPPVMDITGAHRVLAFGPYAVLALGTWRANVVFDVDNDAAKRFYRIDFGADSGFAHVDFRPTKPGRQTVTVTHTFAALEPAWVRLAVGAAFHGQLAFLGAEIEPA